MALNQTEIDPIANQILQSEQLFEGKTYEELMKLRSEITDHASLVAWINARWHPLYDKQNGFTVLVESRCSGLELFSENHLPDIRVHESVNDRFMEELDGYGGKLVCLFKVGEYWDYTSTIMNEWTSDAGLTTIKMFMESYVEGHPIEITYYQWHHSYLGVAIKSTDPEEDVADFKEHFVEAVQQEFDLPPIEENGRDDYAVFGLSWKEFLANQRRMMNRLASIKSFKNEA